MVFSRFLHVHFAVVTEESCVLFSLSANYLLSYWNFEFC